MITIVTGMPFSGKTSAINELKKTHYVICPQKWVPQNLDGHSLEMFRKHAIKTCVSRIVEFVNNQSNDRSALAEWDFEYDLEPIIQTAKSKSHDVKMIILLVSPKACIFRSNNKISIEYVRKYVKLINERLDRYRSICNVLAVSTDLMPITEVAKCLII